MSLSLAYCQSMLSCHRRCWEGRLSPNRPAEKFAKNETYRKIDKFSPILEGSFENRRKSTDCCCKVRLQTNDVAANKMTAQAVYFSTCRTSALRSCDSCPFKQTLAIRKIVASKILHYNVQLWQVPCSM